MLTHAIEWLIDRLFEEYPDLPRGSTVKDHPELSTRDFLRIRIQWGIPKGFSYWWGDELGVYGGILIRPVNDELIRLGIFDYWKHFFDYDAAGDICWVDYAYGPGLYPKMIALCKSTSCNAIGWRHRNRMHIRSMERMPAKGMRLAFHL